MKLTKKMLLRIPKKILIDLLIEEEKELEELYKILYRRNNENDSKKKWRSGSNCWGAFSG